MRAGATRRLLLLALIWLAAAAGDRLWLAVDRSVPGWDEAKYLNCALEYRKALEVPDWGSAAWWHGLWALAPKVPPLDCLAAAPFMDWFGVSVDAALLAHLVFSAVLLVAVHGLGTILVSPQAGVAAGAIAMLVPGLSVIRLEFRPDYLLVSLVALALWCLTAWLAAPRDRLRWPWALALSLALGLAMLAKQAALLFLAVPLAAAIVIALARREWLGALQVAGAIALSSAVWGGWYATNWLLMLTGGQRAVIEAAAQEGDPSFRTLAGWTYYLDRLPALVSWPLLVLAAAGVVVLLAPSGSRAAGRRRSGEPSRGGGWGAVAWLAIFVAGAWVLLALVPNKDPRYQLPLAPALAVLAGVPLARGPRVLRLGLGATALPLAGLLIVTTLWFPDAPGLAPLRRALSPGPPHPPYRGPAWPHAEVVEAIARAEPYLRSTLGVLPSTREVNQHNLGYFGGRLGFHVYGRQVGVRPSQVPLDVAALSWFVTKSGQQGSVPPAQAAAVRAVRDGGDFAVLRSWPLPDASVLALHRRVEPWIAVERAARPKVLTLARVTVPASAPPGAPVPVTYEWVGSWDDLAHAVALLTWRRHPDDPRGADAWLHDHGVAMGALHVTASVPAPAGARVIERTAMRPPPDARGTYELQAAVVDRRSGGLVPLAAPAAAVTIVPGAPGHPAPPLDLLTQLRDLAATLPRGPAALPRLFEEIARIDQYDPVQDYAAQADVALAHRLRQAPEAVEWLYAVALARILQRRVESAIGPLEHIVARDPGSAAARGYLAVVDLHEFRPLAALAALEPVRGMSSAPPELDALRAAALAMSGRPLQAWREFERFRQRAPSPGPSR